MSFGRRLGRPTCVSVVFWQTWKCGPLVAVCRFIIGKEEIPSHHASADTPSTRPPETRASAASERPQALAAKKKTLLAYTRELIESLWAHTVFLWIVACVHSKHSLYTFSNTFHRCRRGPRHRCCKHYQDNCISYCMKVDDVHHGDGLIEFACDLAIMQRAMFVFHPPGFRQDVQHRLPDPVLSQSAFGFQANVLQTVTDTLTVLQQGELPAGGISRLFCEHIQGTFDIDCFGFWLSFLNVIVHFLLSMKLKTVMH